MLRNNAGFDGQGGRLPKAHVGDWDNEKRRR